MKDYPTCPVCGDPVPEGKTLCWCCEHGTKLHKDEQKKCEDSCEIESIPKEDSTK